MTFGECLATLQDILSISKPYRPGLVKGAESIRFTGSHIIPKLTTEQIEAMERAFEKPEAVKSLPVGVPITQLRPDVQAEVFKVACFFYLENKIRGVYQMLDCLEDAQNDDPHFRKKQYDNVDVPFFGIETKYRNPAAGFHFIPLSHPSIVSLLNGSIGGFTAFYSDDPERRKAQNIDQTSPDYQKTESTIKEAIKQPNPFCLTFAEIIARLNARLDSRQTQFSVDPVLSDKRMTIIGSENASPTDTLYAMAELYGLRVRAAPVPSAPTGKILELTRPRTRPVLKITDLPDAMIECYPRDVMRYIIAGTEKTLAAQPGKADKAGPRQGREGTKEEGLALVEKMKQGPVGYVANSMRIIATRQLRKRVDPLLETMPDKRLSFEKINAQERGLVGMIFLVQALGDLQRIATEPVPFFIKDFNSIILVGKREYYRDADGVGQISFYMGTRDKSGQLMQGSGFGGVDYRGPLPPWPKPR